MQIYEMTLKQYQEQELRKYKNSPYWKKALKVKKELRDNIINSKLEKYKNEWYEAVIEYGTYNKLDNKVIYAFDREYGREHLLHCFRGNRKGLENWINSDAIGF